MIETGFNSRVKIQQIIDNQIPEFLLSESPKASEFLKQYYISQEYQGGPVDLADNLDQYLKLDNLTPEVVQGDTFLTDSITDNSDIISVDSTKGFPNQYGLLKIDNEIITYTGSTSTTFTGCVRGFSGITTYHKENSPEELEFSISSSASHLDNSRVINLSSLFLQEFYKKIKFTLTPGLENVAFVPNLDVSNFIKESRSFYQSKGTEESFRILFNILYGESPKVIDLETLLLKPSDAQFRRREVSIVERISGDPLKLLGQTIRRLENPKTQAAVSEIEILTRSGKTYYKLSAFVGYNDDELTEGEFFITGNTKSLETVSIGSSIISVDSTIGFSESGTLISGSNSITYSDKTINQFLGCSNITATINPTDNIRSNDIVYGYEDGDTTKKVELRITGVLSEFIPTSDIYLAEEKETITVKNLGEVINNPETNKTYKEIFANSWIYNTSSRYQIGQIAGSTFTLLSKIDKSSLKIDDNVDILVRGTQNVVVSNALVVNINNSNNQITLNNIGPFSPSVSLDYDIRRKIKKASSSGASLEFGNAKLISDIQNLYNDEHFGYVASNSLPNYNITKNLNDASISQASPPRLQDFDANTQKYSIISFSTNVPFITGDAVVYESEFEPMPGLVSGETYYIQVLTPPNQIRLYTSRSFVGGLDYIQFDSLQTLGYHKFILEEHKTKVISPQKNLRKFPLNHNFEDGFGEETQPGPIGLLINGVEIVSPKSDDKIYYGPLDSIKVVNSGQGYDVINPPRVVVSNPPSGGTTAKVNVAVRGSVKNVLVDPQDFDLDTVVSATISGGNGNGAILNPIVSRRFREVEFDARTLINGGGLDITDETITFRSIHNFINGQPIIYSQNGNEPLGIGTFGPPDLINNEVQNKTLVSGSIYYPKVVNPSTVKLYPTFNDYTVGVNTIGITTENNNGIHKFRTIEKNTLRSIKVLNPGSGYENRNLYISTAGVSTAFNTITFNNHNFKSGDLVDYSTTGTAISGLSTSNQYYVLKIDNDTFKLCDVGIGASITSNYERENYIKFYSVGSGYHIFKYPNINLTVNVSFGSTIVGIITAIPVVTGEIVDAYLYEPGTNYGSDILNLQKTPTISFKTGKNAQLSAIIKNGVISQVDILTGGLEYSSTPELIVSGTGTGAILRPIIENEKITKVIVINGGTNYNSENTKIKIEPAGKNALIVSSIRSLTVNKQSKFGDEILEDTLNNLEYAFVGYPVNIGNSNFGDSGLLHSPIIGWAYDGNPIYGPYGYSNPEDITSSLKVLSTGYTLNTSNIINRPSPFGPGFFIEDYSFDASGDLDIHNGRFCKTPEFPNGIYAYFVGVSTDISTNTLVANYPYFIGDSYRSPLIEENFTLNQTFDFNNSSLSRNTFPYKVNDPYADNDFLIESNEIVNQVSLIESVSKGSVESFTILESGDDYKIGDVAVFDNDGTNGGGLSAVVSSILGRQINKIESQVDSYNNSILTWKDQNTVLVSYQPYHELLDGDNIVISGLTTSISKLFGNHKVGLTSERIVLFKDVLSNVVPGKVEDIFVSNIPPSVSVGSSITIESEILSVLNIFDSNSILRVRRSDIGAAHTSTTIVNILPNKFTIPVKTSYFDSTLNDLVYFNPNQSVGVGTTAGIGINLTYTVGEYTQQISVTTQNIYLPNHPFKTGQQVTFNKKSGTSALVVSNTSGGSSFNLPFVTNSETVYVINKSKDFIGLTTSVGLTTNTGGLFFFGNGSNNYEYSLGSNYDQVIGTVEKIKTTVSVSTSHNMQNGDIVKLEVKPNISVGVGSSTSVRVKYDQNSQRLLINPVGFNSSNINTTTDTITINSHHFETGDKVQYNSTDLIASGLTTGGYFVYKIDDNKIQLTETFKDLNQSIPKVVDIISVGGTSHIISLINPKLDVVKNSTLKFDLSDPSLINYKLKFYYDQNFDNEFISTGLDSQFNISGVGTVGVGTVSTYSLRYSDGFPTNLYYSFEKNGVITNPDTEVRNYSEIFFIDSVYSGSHVISGVAATTFNISLYKIPEQLSYNQSQCDLLKYSTTSETAIGGVNNLQILFGGYAYKKIPKFVDISSENGFNANILSISTSIGRINKVRVLDQGFEYSSDKTLRPEAYISPILSIINSSTIDNVNVLDGGKNYSSAPNLLIFNPDTLQVVDSESLTCKVYSNSISEVVINVKSYGLSSINHKIIAIDNSNGVGVNSVTSSVSGIVTCILSTPITGFSTSVFEVGDEIFVEGIQKEGTNGTGFNSSDYNYQFFTVTSYQNTNPARLEFNIAGLTTNPGFAKTNQTAFASIINKKNYPIFEVVQSFSTFIIGEKLLSSTGTGFFERDLTIKESRQEYIKVDGFYTLSKNEVIKGKNSGVLATIADIVPNTGKFQVDYSIRQDYGWLTDSGKINESYQVTSDNDYYQNLSYSVRSSIQFNDLVDPVNRLLHTAGLKNFADVQIESRSGIASYTQTTNDLIVLDVVEEKRVDTINNFDLTIDIDTYENKSKYIKLKNKKLTDYISCISNRVLIIDDVSNRFSNKESSKDPYVDISTLEDSYYKYLVQIIDPNSSSRQLTELVVLSNDDDVFTLEKGTLTNTEIELGDLIGSIDTFDSKSLRFLPNDIFDTDYDIKVLQSNFNSNISGINTQSVGFVNLTGSNSVVGVGSTATIISIEKDTVESLFVNIQILNTVTNRMNYVELFLDHDGNDTYLAEYYFDSSSGITTQFIGSFNPVINGSKLSLEYANNDINSILVRSKIVGFGTTSIGIGTYRFTSTNQPDGSERSAYLTSNYNISSTVSDIIGINTDNSTSVKSLVYVSYGQTSALHQVMMIQDKFDVYTLQYPFLSIGSTSGIGTFGGEIVGSNAILRFYPDSSISANLQIQSYNEVLYTENDYNNEPEILNFGTATEEIILSAFDSINGDRSNKLDFDLNYGGIPIYKKIFNPSDTSVLDTSTGIFTIKDHFFSNAEQLVYTPKSSFIGVGETSVGIGATLNSSGIVTNRLPSDVYAISINSDQFQLSTRKDYALAGIYVTFTSFGQGNVHELEMSKKLEKSIISIDGVVQKPITFTPISHKLENNGGQISVGTTYFALSGISTLKPKDLIKIDHEYMNIVSVGLGTTSIGPISGIGSVPIVQVERGFVGSSVTTHTDSAEVRVYRGSFNIVGSKIYFTAPPKGSGRVKKDFSNLPFPTSNFAGRVYLRNDYSTNVIYDDIADQFTGIGQTYTLKVQGINTTGIQTGSGVLFINDIFQTPTTTNNSGNNYQFFGSVGISSVVFTGITSSNGSIIKNDFDVNQNQLPRGGIIVSLGSTPGLGFAPLVGSSVTSVVSSGSIVSVGLGTTDILGSGYNGIVSIGVTEIGHIGYGATITATVGAGGTLTFNVVYGGTGYTNPTIQISSPSYENLPVIGVSRRGIGNTTDTGSNLLITLDVGASSTTGIGSTLFEVSSFSISRPGYGFQIGDVFKPVGLVVDRNLSNPISEFELTVLDTFTDSFSSWQFGELDYIDSIKNLQDGSRIRFPLYYNGQLLSFEKDLSNPSSVDIDLNSVLLIFINGVIQEPGSSYQFEGGTSFTFSNAPITEDEISIFFYRGTRNVDSASVNVNESVKIGDLVQVFKNDLYAETITQDIRRIDNIPGSDKLETNVYTGLGIDEINYRPFSWTKQKVDSVINGDYVYKSRDSIEPQIYPTAKIIKNISNISNEIFVDNAKFFNYEEDNYSTTINNFEALIVQGTDSVSAGMTAVVSVGGTIQSLVITNSGSGYIGTTLSVKISSPQQIGVGIGTIASASVSIVNGQIAYPITITNSGFGYSQNNPPQVIVDSPNLNYELVTNITGVEGFSGIITGITTTTGIYGNPLALKFYINTPSLVGLATGYPVYIFDTLVGNKVTSIDSGESSIVGIGTTCLDNIYYIHNLIPDGSNAEIITNISSTTNISGITTSGSLLGRFSWGRFYNLSRSANPISIGVTGLTIDSGLSTFANIQRKGYGLRDTGAIRKIVG